MQWHNICCKNNMTHRTKSLFLLFALCSAPAMAEPTFELAQLENMALQSSRALHAARDQVSAARAGIDTAGAFPNPELEYLAGNLRPRLPGGSTGDVRSTTLTQPLDMPWRRNARIEVAEASLATTAAGYEIFQADLLARLRTRYFELLRRDAELRNAREDKTLMENVRSRIALRVETGEAPRFELIKAEAESLNAQKIAQAASLRLEQSRFLLRQTVGDRLPVDFQVAGNLRSAPKLPPIDQLRQAFPEISPDLARARAEKRRAERQLDLERAQRWPDIALKTSVDQDPEMRAAKFGIVLSIPLWDRRSGPMDEAAAQLSRARNELAAQEFSLTQTLEVALQQYEIAETQVTALESGIVKQAEAALKVAEAAYRFGERGFLEVLDAQRVYRAARSELIAARFELAAAWVEIERLRASPGGKTE